MALTPAQLATLKAAIIADPTAGPMRTAGDTAALLAWCNGASATLAWRPVVSGDEIYAAHKPKDYLARSAAERSGFDLMCRQTRLDFTVGKIRTGIADMFSGTTNNSSRTDIFTAAQVAATNAQLVLGGASASVGGTADMVETVTALKRNFVDPVSQDEVNKLVN
jgi:hypothetical protein